LSRKANGITLSDIDYHIYHTSLYSYCLHINPGEYPFYLYIGFYIFFTLTKRGSGIGKTKCGVPTVVVPVYIDIRKSGRSFLQSASQRGCTRDGDR
jgi:hypothetical protein